MWSAITEPGTMALYIDPAAILPQPGHPSHREEATA
jgi:hypothetical protein